jgi:oligopeptide transport system substrate-binding protein
MANAKFKRAAVILMAALLGTAVGPGCRRESRVDAGTRAGSDLDPNTNIDTTTETILNGLFEGLVGVAADGLTVVPGVASSWDVSPDGLVYTFHLRPDARWSNGAPVTSDDFKFSFQRVFDPLVACEESSFGFAIAGSEAYALGRNKDVSTLGLAAPDPRTFVVTLSHPAPYFLDVLGSGSPFLPVYRPLLEKFGGVHQRGTPWTREGNLIGNGPFVLTRWTQNQVIELRKNPGYWDAARVKLNGINFYSVDDPSVQEQGFRSGEFHIETRFPIFKEAAYADLQPKVLFRAPIQSTNFVTFNVATAPYTDGRVRRALSMAIDRRKLCAAVFHSFAEPAFTQVRPGTGGYTLPESHAFQFDPDGARRLLAEAGFPGGKGFPPVELMLVGSDPSTVNLGEVVQASWRDVLGLTTNLSPTEKKVYLDAERTKNFHLIIENWDYPWNDPSAYYMTGQTGNPNNDSGWSDPAFDKAYAQADATLDRDARTRAFAIQEARLAEGVPYAPLYFPNAPFLVTASVHGWTANAKRHVEWKDVSVGP